MKVLIIQYEHVGDVLISSIIANNLKKIYTDIKIDFLCYKKYRGVLQKNPSIDRIIAVDSERIGSLFFLYRYIKLVRSEKYDILIDLSHNFSSLQISAFSGAKKKYSFHHPIFNKIYDKTFQKATQPITQTCNMLENRIMIIEEFLKDNPAPIDPQVKIYLTKEEVEEYRENMYNAGIKFTRPVIMLGVFGSNINSTWTIGSMAKLIDSVWTYYRADLLLNYLPSQYPQVNELISLLNPNTKVFVQPVGKTVREYANYMQNCNLFIGNDSRAVMIAKALQKPTFTIYPPYVHKEEVACYENTSLNQSVHLHDLLPNLYDNFYQNELYKDSTKFYLMLSNEFVIQKVRKFLKEQLSAF